MIIGRSLAFSLHTAFDNMAIDQALAHSVGAGAAPTLRWYGWSDPTLSLGYFQSIVDLPHDPSLVVVRRGTGGGAIVHHHELTYSLTLPLDDLRIGSHDVAYQSVHAAVRQTLGELAIAAAPHRELASTISGEPTTAPEPFLCFARRTAEDLIVAGYKIVGSAQRRLRGGLLQHGSLLLSVSPHADELPGIAQLTGQCLEPILLSERLTGAIGERLGINFRSGNLTAAEISEADQIQSERFGNDAWTNRR